LILVRLGTLRGADRGLPTTYELAATVDPREPSGPSAIGLLVCDVVADMRRDLYRILPRGPQQSKCELRGWRPCHLDNFV
jgi:hypothetical protein